MVVAARRSWGRTVGGGLIISGAMFSPRVRVSLARRRWRVSFALRERDSVGGVFGVVFVVGESGEEGESKESVC
jgi:hypothetical protein